MITKKYAFTLTTRDIQQKIVYIEYAIKYIEHYKYAIDTFYSNYFIL